MRLFISAGTIALATAIGTPALADETATLGGPLQLAVSNDMQLGVQGQSYSAPNGQTSPGSTTVVALEPAADFFVIQGLSVGGQLIYLHLSTSSSVPGASGVSADGFGIVPRVGYNLALGDTFSIWPKVFFEYLTTSSGNGGGNSNSVSIGAFVPFLVHPAKHFFLGLGPNVETELSNTLSVNGHGADAVKTTRYGLMFVVGGWVSLGG
jgi:hypothetical protein